MASSDVMLQPEWVADLEKDLAVTDAASSEQTPWKKHSVHRVPATVKSLHPRAYQPQVVSLGPFHHGHPNLIRMETHKRRAVRQILRRSGRKLGDFVAAVAAVAKELEDAYEDLGDEWRQRERFLQVMVTDGCFLLEMMRRKDYERDDPVFGRHGELYVVPYVRRDMLILDNQLPLLVLQKLLAVETGKEFQHVEYEVNRIVRRFMSPSCQRPPAMEPVALHPLDVLRKSLISGPYQRHGGDGGGDEEDYSGGIVRSATELYDGAGVRFKRSKTASLNDVTFRRGMLSLPFLAVDDSTEYMFLNLMAFERLHAGAGNDVTAYVFFMDNIIGSAADVALLASKGIIQNAIGSDKAVAEMFNGLAKDVTVDPDSELDAVQRMVNRYCRSSCHVWRANLVRTYFRSPWVLLCLTTH